MRMTGVSIILFCAFCAFGISMQTPDEYVPMIKAAGIAAPAIFSVIGWVYAMSVGLRLLDIHIPRSRCDQELTRQEKQYVTELILEKVEDGTYAEKLRGEIAEIRDEDD